MQGAGPCEDPDAALPNRLQWPFAKTGSARPWLSSPTFCPTWTSSPWRLICSRGKTTPARPMYSGARSWPKPSTRPITQWLGTDPPFPSQLLHPPGDWNRPIVDVGRIRDGKSTTLGARAQDGQAILGMDASFQTDETAWNTRERPQRSRSLKTFAAITTATGSLPSSTRAFGALPFATRPSRAGRWRAFS